MPRHRKDLSRKGRISASSKPARREAFAARGEAEAEAEAAAWLGR